MTYQCQVGWLECYNILAQLGQTTLLHCKITWTTKLDWYSTPRKTLRNHLKKQFHQWLYSNYQQPIIIIITVISIIKHIISIYKTFLRVFNLMRLKLFYCLTVYYTDRPNVTSFQQESKWADLCNTCNSWYVLALSLYRIHLLISAKYNKVRSK